MQRHLIRHPLEPQGMPPITVTVEGDDEIDSARVRWMARNQVAFAKERFEDEYVEIERTHGAVEIVWAADTTHVVRIQPPANGLRESDSLELERFGEGSLGIDTARAPMSSAGLRRLADGLYADCLAQWELFRTDAQYTYSTIYEEAQYAGETIPDFNGDAPTPSELLSRASHVASRLRYYTHNLHLEIGSWALIRDYFAELEELDAVQGRFGALPMRRRLVSQVKKLLDRKRRALFVKFATLIGAEPSLRRYVGRVRSHPDFMGAVIGSAGALLRVIQQPADGQGFERLMESFATALGSASQEEISSLSPTLLDAWADVEMVSDIFTLLGPSDDDWRNAPTDDRYREVAMAGRRSESIFRAASIERHIKSGESLKSDTVLKKIWAEVDKVSMKREKKSYEKVLAFREVTPYWNHIVPFVAATAQAPATEESTQEPAPPSPLQRPLELYSFESLEYISERSTTPEVEQPVQEKQEEEAHTAPIVQPVQDDRRPEALEAKEEEEEETHAKSMQVRVEPQRPILRPLTPPPRKGPKVKTRGTPSAQLQPAAAAAPVTQAEDKSVWFYVGRKIYETFEHLLIPFNNPMNWVDFEKALTMGCGFSKKPSSGSRVVFASQDKTNTPFCVHRPHGSEMPSHLVRNLGKRLKTLYGWSLDRFSPERGPLAPAA